MYTFTYKPPDWFILPEQVRLATSEAFSEAELRPLGESLKVRQLAPVGAQLDGTLLWGFRRVRAALLVKIKQLATIITDEKLTESEIKMIQLTENMARMNLSGFEQFKACEELMRLNPSWTAKDLAAHLHKDNSLITRIMAPSKCIPDVQEALKQGRISLAHCYAISQYPIGAEQHQGLEMAIAGCPREQIDSARRARNGANGEKIRVSRIKIELKSGVTVIFAGKDISLDDAILAAPEAAALMKKGQANGYTAKTISKMSAEARGF